MVAAQVNKNGSNVTVRMLVFAFTLVGAMFAFFVWIQIQFKDYLTLREHQAFFDTTVRDIKRFEESQNQQNALIDKLIADRASKESTTAINKRIEQIYSLINEMRRDVSDLQKHNGK